MVSKQKGSPGGRKPVGHTTRGKTAHNRLRQVDNFLLRYAPGLIARQGTVFDHALFVDLGYGAEAWTTLETAERFRRLNPVLPILGVEIEPDRVEAALPFQDEHTQFRLGGFNIPLLGSETIRLIRAFNVLRQYDESQVVKAWMQMAEHVIIDGLLIEGTSNPTGSIWSANVLRRNNDGWKQEALVFYSNFRSGFDPVDFQTILPKNYIHNVVKGHKIGDFFSAWRASAVETKSSISHGPKNWFRMSATVLKAKGYQINLRPGWLLRGWMIWENPENH